MIIEKRYRMIIKKGELNFTHAGKALFHSVEEGVKELGLEADQFEACYCIFTNDSTYSNLYFDVEKSLVFGYQEKYADKFFAEYEEKLSQDAAQINGIPKKDDEVYFRMPTENGCKIITVKKDSLREFLLNYPNISQMITEI